MLDMPSWSSNPSIAVFVSLMLGAALSAGCAAEHPPPASPPVATTAATAEGDRPRAPLQVAGPFGDVTKVADGLKGDIYLLPANTGRLPDFASLKPSGSVYTTTLDITPRAFDQGFPGVTDRFEWFAIDYTGTLMVASPGEVRFRLTADDGAKLFIDGGTVIDNDGLHPPTAVEGAVTLTEGQHQIHVPYFQGPRNVIALTLEVAQGQSWEVLRVDRPLRQ